MGTKPLIPLIGGHWTTDVTFTQSQRLKRFTYVVMDFRELSDVQLIVIFFFFFYTCSRSGARAGVEGMISIPMIWPFLSGIRLETGFGKSDNLISEKKIAGYPVTRDIRPDNRYPANIFYIRQNQYPVHPKKGTIYDSNNQRNNGLQFWLPIDD